MSSHHLIYILISLICFTSQACGTGSQNNLTGPQKLSSKNSNSEWAWDMNGDQKPDVWRHYVQEKGKKRITHKSFDFNFDGRVDFKRYYTPTGEVIRDEMDMDYDNTFDMTTYYKNNVIERKDVNVIGDKKPEVFKYYKSGKLSYLEGDRDGDEKLDYWEYYRDGKLVRRGSDRNFDGKPDHWDELD